MIIRDEQFKIGIYIRLSKEDDRINESESISNQRLFILNYLNDNDYKTIKEYIDDGYSGTTFERPAFKEMLNDIEEKKINMVVTKDLSRLGRDYIECGYYIEKYFPLKNIRYIAILDNVDTYNEIANNDIIPFKAIINDWYAKDISRKVRSALTAKKRLGYCTSPKICYGYLKQKNKIIIEKDKARIINLIFQQRLKGFSLSAIRSYLYQNNIVSPGGKNRWSTKTIKEILMNQMYCGDLIQNKTKKLSYKNKQVVKLPRKEWLIKPNNHQAIIQRSNFESVQKTFTSSNNKCKHKLLLNGLLYCYECGHSLGINKAHNRNQYYLSCNYYKTYSQFNVCSPHTLNYHHLEKAISEYFQDIILKTIDMEQCYKYIKKRGLVFKNDVDYNLVINKIIDDFDIDILLLLIKKIMVSENNEVLVMLNAKI